MDDQDDSQELLIASYIFSARRIRAALANKLTIRNSRKPIAPSGDENEIIGLCGQGGHHPYFRIPFSYLNWALDKIMRLENEINQRNSSLQSSVDELAYICQELRRQTDFDIATGCVNDRVPQMVPLLTPEEIWYRGRELPLDVWRLISFEFDLASGAISSQTRISDIGFGSATQGALTFAYIMNQVGNRRIHFELQGRAMPPDLNQQLNPSIRIETNVARLFFEAGCLLTPLADQAFARWYPALRYLHWIDSNSSSFRVKDEFRRNTVDSRYKGLFAEEMAIGLMAIILSERLGVIRINNTVEVLTPGSYQTGQPIADFVAQRIDPSNSQTELIVAESKGSLGRRVSQGRRNRAKTQVQTTRISLPGANRVIPLTFCSRIVLSSQQTVTNCEVEDPENDYDSSYLEIDESTAWRAAYAKAFRFIGQEIAARQVSSGEVVRFLQPVDFSRNIEYDSKDQRSHRLRRAKACHERFHADILFDIGHCGVCINSSVREILSNYGIQAEIHRKLAHVLKKRSWISKEHLGLNSFLNSLGLGLVFYSDLGE